MTSVRARSRASAPTATGLPLATPDRMTRVALVGSEFEENLSLRYLAAAVRAAGHAPAIVPFDRAADRPRVVAEVLALDPMLVGISVPFQHRAPELLGLAEDLRRGGYRGHVCVGGHFATFEYASILSGFRGIDSVVRHEGEETLVALCGLVAGGAPLDGTPGLISRSDDRLVIGPKRPIPKLDALPFPDRTGTPHDVLGVHCSPILGSRGCYADCSFCCIYAYAENAAGARYRMRSPEDIVEEMQREYHGRGVRLFVFHDDNFFLPYGPSNLKRYERMARLLRQAGLDDIGVVIKCRPNDVDPELFRLLKSMGVIRAYVGIETNSDAGVVSLNRRITPADNRRALALLRELDLYCSFNVLIFDPEATLGGVEANLAFMEEFADVPFNFCRAEVYAGTPLKAMLERDGRLRGDYLAWTYELRCPRTELLFRIATRAFFSRNFKPDGIANLNMGIRFDAEVFRHFYSECWDEAWQARLVDFSRRVGLDTVARMREAAAFAAGCDLDDRAGVGAYTLELARGVARADLALLAEVKALRRGMEDRVEAARGHRPVNAGRAPMPVWAAETARLGSSTGRELSAELLPAPSTLERRT